MGYTAEQAAKELWLLYYNRVLLEKGIITGKAYNRMKVKIQCQSTSRNQEMSGLQ